MLNSGIHGGDPAAQSYLAAKYGYRLAGEIDRLEVSPFLLPIGNVHLSAA